MQEAGSRQATFVLSIIVAVALAACSKPDASTADTGMGTDTGMAIGGSDAGMPPAPSATGLTDANIVYILDQANALDSASGAIAVVKGTNSEVREFGRLMVRDHHGLRERGEALAKKLAITAAAPPNDNAKAELDRVLSMLNGAAKGRGFDKAYIDDQVTYHVNLLATATSAMSAAQNAELKNFIQKAAPAVQAHLDGAQAIRKKLQ